MDGRLQKRVSGKAFTRNKKQVAKWIAEACLDVKVNSEKPWPTGTRTVDVQAASLGQKLEQVSEKAGDSRACYGVEV